MSIINCRRRPLQTDANKKETSWRVAELYLPHYIGSGQERGAQGPREMGTKI